MLHLRAVTAHEQANEYDQNTHFVDVKLQFNLKQYKQHSHRGQNNQQLVEISNNGKKKIGKSHDKGNPLFTTDGSPVTPEIDWSCQAQ